MEEIILNIEHQISLSKYNRNQLIGGMIITGGASQIQNIEKAITEYTKFDKLRFVRNIRTTLRTKLADFNRNGSCNAAIALIESGDQNCCGGDLGDPTKSIFPTEEEIKQQQEEERRKQEEEERRLEMERQAEIELQQEQEAETRKAERRGGAMRSMRSFFSRIASLVSDEDTSPLDTQKDSQNENATPNQK